MANFLYSLLLEWVESTDYILYFSDSLLVNLQQMFLFLRVDLYAAYNSFSFSQVYISLCTLIGAW